MRKFYGSDDGYDSYRDNRLMGEDVRGYIDFVMQMRRDREEDEKKESENKE